MARKIFEKQTVDLETGEITSITSEYVRHNVERFFMGRTTEGIEWLLKFKNITEIVLFIMMGELENPRNQNIISFTKLQVQESAKILNVSESMVKKCISSLVENDFLKRIERGNYLANPLTFYRGQSKDVIARYTKYKSIGIDKSED